MSLPHLAVLLVAGLFILGPERLPQTAAWAGRALRQVREHATGAQQRLQEEFGDDLREPLEQLREPLQQLNALRNADPRRAVVNYLLDDRADSHSTTARPSPRGLSGGEKPPFDADAT
ncbi:twin-arginine translocase TatA/TatE family subunit [Saccharopolyspora sp. NPDC002686]|uniref:twin-arginine translocase TatA/TatE family subunit n=1 Tax=Saccharopolyspora sp. NPDC002686 TaxID=3154541 RepID=UPI0033306778